MSLFYFDDKIWKHEKELDYSPIITYLEDLYLSEKEVQYLTTLVAYAWYFYIEGDVNIEPVNYDSDFLLSKWKQYFELGIKEHIDIPEFCYVAGYTFYLHGFFIHEAPIDETEEGIKLIQKCLELSKDEHLKALAKDFIENSRPREYKKLENAKHICDKLFPFDSILDEYFRATLIKNRDLNSEKDASEKEKKRRVALDKKDRKVISTYLNLPFPSVVRKMNGLNYINNLNSTLELYCLSLQSGVTIKNYVPCDDDEALIEEEFRYVIDRTEGKDRDEMIDYHRFYNEVKAVLKKYRDMYAELGIL